MVMAGGLVTRPAVVLAASLEIMRLHNLESELAPIAINDVLTGMREPGPLGSFYTEVALRLVGWGMLSSEAMRAAMTSRAA